MNFLLSTWQHAGNLNPFVPNVPFLYPLKTSGGRKRVHWERMGALLLTDIDKRLFQSVRLCNTNILISLLSHFPFLRSFSTRVSISLFSSGFSYLIFPFLSQFFSFFSLSISRWYHLFFHFLCDKNLMCPTWKTKFELRQWKISKNIL